MGLEYILKKIRRQVHSSVLKGTLKSIYIDGLYELLYDKQMFNEVRRILFEEGIDLSARKVNEPNDFYLVASVIDLDGKKNSDWIAFTAENIVKELIKSISTHLADIVKSKNEVVITMDINSVVMTDDEVINLLISEMQKANIIVVATKQDYTSVRFSFDLTGYKFVEGCNEYLQIIETALKSVVTEGMIIENIKKDIEEHLLFGHTNIRIKVAKRFRITDDLLEFLKEKGCTEYIVYGTTNSSSSVTTLFVEFGERDTVTKAKRVLFNHLI